MSTNDDARSQKPNRRFWQLSRDRDVHGDTDSQHVDRSASEPSKGRLGAERMSRRELFAGAAVPVGGSILAVALENAPALAWQADIAAVNADPVFALIEAERAAWDAFSAANSIAADLDDDLRFAARVQEVGVKTTEVTTVVEYLDSPSRPSERTVSDVISRSRKDIIAVYAKPESGPCVVEANGRRVTRSAMAL